ncbi:hypothetical protein J25TS5_35600 [Paenibacillus faecis]|nr:hypothetical protein J25TS5_35600 [Paenibacillus faecis]
MQCQCPKGAYSPTASFRGGGHRPEGDTRDTPAERSETMLPPGTAQAMRPPSAVRSAVKTPAGEASRPRQAPPALPEDGVGAPRFP